MLINGIGELCAGEAMATNLVLLISNGPVPFGSYPRYEVRGAGENRLEVRYFDSKETVLTNQFAWNQTLGEVAFRLRLDFAKDPREYRPEEAADRAVEKLYPQGVPDRSLCVRLLGSDMEHSHCLTAKNHVLMSFIEASPYTYQFFLRLSQNVPKGGKLAFGSGPNSEVLSDPLPSRSKPVRP
jgi:hypothetical protein